MPRYHAKSALTQGAHLDLDTRRDKAACGPIALRCMVNVATVQRSEHDRTHLRERSHLLGRMPPREPSEDDDNEEDEEDGDAESDEDEPAVIREPDE